MKATPRTRSVPSIPRNHISKPVLRKLLKIEALNPKNKRFFSIINTPHDIAFNHNLYSKSVVRCTVLFLPAKNTLMEYSFLIPCWSILPLHCELFFYRHLKSCHYPTKPTLMENLVRRCLPYPFLLAKSLLTSPWPLFMPIRAFTCPNIVPNSGHFRKLSLFSSDFRFRYKG